MKKTIFTITAVTIIVAITVVNYRINNLKVL